MSDKVRLVAGVDVGNGYVKSKTLVEGEQAPHLADFPSAAAFTADAPLPRPVTRAFLDDLAARADIDVSSSALDAVFQGRVLLGERAVRSGKTLTEFEIDAARPKCEDPLSTLLLLDVVASEALRAWSFAHSPQGQTKDMALPDVLEVEATVALALPIEDYVRWNRRYSERLCASVHNVRFLGLEGAIGVLRPVDVRVSFKDVVVLAEGAAGQYAIVSLGADALDWALDDARSQGLPVDEAYTGAMLVAACNTIGVDIGEGTVNFPVFTDGDIAVESSSSIRQGWGSVLEDVVVRLRASRNPFGSRKALADFLLVDKPLPAQERLRSDVERELSAAKPVFARTLMGEFGRVWRRVGNRTDVVFVYGGGASWVKDVVWPMLCQAATMQNGFAVPVVWMDSSWSRDLNRNGLFEAARLAAETRRDAEAHELLASGDGPDADGGQ